MKKLIYVLLIAFTACKSSTDDVTIGGGTMTCSAIESYKDTLAVGPYKLYLISVINKSGMGTLEIVDKNNNYIDGSGDFSINMVQLRNGSNCWELTNVKKINDGATNSYDGNYSGFPAWAKESATQTTIKLTVSGTSYFLMDDQLVTK